MDGWMILIQTGSRNYVHRLALSHLKHVNIFPYFSCSEFHYFNFKAYLSNCFDLLC